jgi:hypothetical protein
MVRAVALVFGVSFLAVGVLGFILNPTGGELLGIFAVHVLHNLVHLLFGIFGTPLFWWIGRGPICRGWASSTSC